MSAELDRKPPFAEVALPDKKDASLAELEQRLQASEDLRKTQLFYCVAGMVVMFDIIALPAHPWGFVTLIMLLELCVLVPFASHCGVEQAAVLLNWLRHVMSGSQKK